MAITTGLSGNTNTIDTTGSQVTLWKRSVDRGHPVEFTLEAGTAAVTFRIFADEDGGTKLAEVIVPAGERRTVADTRRDSFALLTAQSANGSAVPAWYPSVLGGV